MPRPFVISLPIEDRRRSLAFYTDGLGLEATGPLADDGIPEPLQLVLDAHVTLMLIPREGFGWVAAPHAVAEQGTSECQLSWAVDDDGAVDAAIERARAAGATVLQDPGPQPWGYSSLFADPDGHLWMVIAPTGA